MSQFCFSPTQKKKEKPFSSRGRQLFSTFERYYIITTNIPPTESWDHRAVTRGLVITLKFEIPQQPIKID